MVDFSGFHVGKEFLSPKGNEVQQLKVNSSNFVVRLEDDWLPGKPRKVPFLLGNGQAGFRGVQLMEINSNLLSRYLFKVL